MNKKQICRFKVPDINSLPEDIKNKIKEISQKIGFIPNIFLALSYRPEEFRSFFSYHDAIMNKQSGLTKAEKEMIIVATSSQNRCLYCVIAHGAVLRIYSKSSQLSDQIATNYRKAEITTKQKMMLDFAIKICDDSKNINDNDIKKLKKSGFSDDDIWDISSITSFFAMSNRLANTFNISPNNEFYEMGRKIFH